MKNRPFFPVMLFTCNCNKMKKPDSDSTSLKSAKFEIIIL